LVCSWNSSVSAASCQLLATSSFLLIEVLRPFDQPNLFVTFDDASQSAKS